VLITLGISLWETMGSGAHAYFDAAITLLFFLLIGRYLDLRARGRARATAEHLLVLGNRPLTVEGADGGLSLLPPDRIVPGMTVLVAAGERIGVDGVVTAGMSEVDTSLLTGETLPKPVAVDAPVFAGTLNVAAPLRVRTTSSGEGTVLAEMSRLVAMAEQSEGRYVRLADRLARIYAPVVHVMAFVTFMGWTLFTNMPWQDAMMIAVSVLVITCPCALALAVPVVQVIASGVLLRKGILLKSATALERCVSLDTAIFDKTGTLTVGRPVLVGTESCDGSRNEDALSVAASLAAVSRHPLARALVREKNVPAAEGVEERPGAGLLLTTDAGEVRLGSAAFCGVAQEVTEHNGPELWLVRPRHAPVRFVFDDVLRPDAAHV
ncbi:MAG: HAD family hydrolase, partial [Bacteroidetes bacterium]|nr:HAD family hydrolase [Bacteroidota bacterium]